MLKVIPLPPAHRLSNALFGVVLGVMTLSLGGQFMRYVVGRPRVFGLVDAFYVDFESSIPTWYSSAALCIAAFLLGLIAWVKRQHLDAYRWHWATLSGLLLLLSADEIAMFHELPIDPLRSSWGFGGVLYYAWVIPGMALVAGVACLYLRFFLSLPRRTQWLMAGAAATFVSGAIGVEMLSGAYAQRYGEANFGYAAIITVEEFLEMAGVVLLIRALLDYIQRQLGGLQIQLPAAGDPTPSESH